MQKLLLVFTLLALIGVSLQTSNSQDAVQIHKVPQQATLDEQQAGQIQQQQNQIQEQYQIQEGQFQMEQADYQMYQSPEQIQRQIIYASGFILQEEAQAWRWKGPFFEGSTNCEVNFGAVRCQSSETHGFWTTIKNITYFTVGSYVIKFTFIIAAIIGVLLVAFLGYKKVESESDRHQS